MKKGGGKQKGASFEREICKQLSLWISNNERQDLFWRSAMSGGRSTVALKQGDKLSSQAGDISSIDQLGHEFISTYYVECKFYKSLDLHLAMLNTGKLLNFWTTTKKEAKEYKKFPVMIAKQNRYPILVCLDNNSLSNFEITKRNIDCTYTKHNLHILTLDNFFTTARKI